jgi:uncharacterized protein (TIGR02588 family)
MAEEKKNSQRKNGQEKEPPSLLEWIFAAVGLLVITSAVGFLIYRGATKGNAPPAIKIEVESVSQSGENYLVSFRALNSGDTTVAELTIEGELKNGAGTGIETSDIKMTYLPAQSMRRGGLFFTRNPNEYQLQIRAKGFEQP